MWLAGRTLPRSGIGGGFNRGYNVIRDSRLNFSRFSYSILQARANLVNNNWFSFRLGPIFNTALKMLQKWSKMTQNESSRTSSLNP